MSFESLRGVCASAKFRPQSSQVVRSGTQPFRIVSRAYALRNTTTTTATTTAVKAQPITRSLGVKKGQEAAPPAAAHLLVLKYLLSWVLLKESEFRSDSYIVFVIFQNLKFCPFPLLQLQTAAPLSWRHTAYPPHPWHELN